MPWDFKNASVVCIAYNVSLALLDAFIDIKHISIYVGFSVNCMLIGIIYPF